MKRLLLILVAAIFAGQAQAQCAAAFSHYASPAGNYVLRHHFLDQSSTGSSFAGKQVTSHIDFGDGFGDWFWNSAASHAYAAPGTYNIVHDITVFDSINNVIVCVDTLRDTIHVSYPACAFTVASTKVNDSTYTFTATSVSSSTTPNFVWSFGDGSSGTGSSVTHTYARSGSYFISVNDSNSSCSYWNSLALSVAFLGPFDCDSIQPILIPSVNARTVSIAVQSNIGWYSGKALSFTYDYGDGSAVTSSSSHAYNATGNYTITAYGVCTDSATSAVLCRDTLSSPITIFSLYASLGGLITYDSATYSTSSTVKVYLIAQDTAAGTLTAVDSQSLQSSAWLPYFFQNVPPGRYLVKAAWPYTGGTGIVPTYADSSLLWSGARVFNHDGVNNIYYANIAMRTGIQTSGPGFVGGSVALGANKGTASGAPGVSMILADAAGKLVAMTETDGQGNYAFTNVPAGTYTVLPELLGYDAMSSAPFSITASSTSVSGVSFIKDDTKMNIRSSALGLAQVRAAVLRVSPNPAHGFVRISAIDRISAAVPVELRDLSGKIVLRAALEPGRSLDLDISRIPAGLYFLYPESGSPLKLVVR